MKVFDAISLGPAAFAFCGNEDDPTLVPFAEVPAADLAAYLDDNDNENIDDNDNENIEATTPPKSKEKKQPFPRELNHFSFGQSRFLICGNEIDPESKDKTDTTNSLEVAQKIAYVDMAGVITYSILINTLIAPNLRKLAQQFGLKNLGSKTKFQIRLAMAEKKNSDNRYNINALASKITVTSNDNTKNIVRVINTIFHPDNFETFLTLNDRKARSDFEVGNGANNINFWAIMADYVNDVTNEDLDKFLPMSGNEKYTEYITKAEAVGYLPTSCSQQTGVTCKGMIDGLVKIRSTMIANMTKSGENANDPYLYTAVAIKRHNLVRSVSNFAAYYFYMACTDHPEMDSVLKRFLGKTVKADSTNSVLTDVSSIATKKKDADSNLTKLIEHMGEVGSKFGSHFESQKLHFEEQKKRYDNHKLATATKQYCDMKLLIIKEPALETDMVITQRMKNLKNEIESLSTLCTYHRSPPRKKTCLSESSKLNGSSSLSKSDSDDSSSCSSIPTEILKDCGLIDEDN
jgi:hypothetical protein